jgi:hypothetical protein
LTKPATYLTERFHLALKYANSWHMHQSRKSTDLAYILHPLGVASLVLEAGGNEDEAIAALLHDVPEDHGGEPRLTEIKSQFGIRVEEIVRACSDSLVEDRDSKADYQERKQAHLSHLADADNSTLLVTAADKLHNARSIATDFLNHGDDLWGRFNGSKEQILWYYESMYFLLCRRNLTPTLLTPLREAVKLLGGKVGLDYFFDLDSHNEPESVLRYGRFGAPQERWNGSSWVKTNRVSDYFHSDVWLDKTTELAAIERFPEAFGL